MKKRFSLRKGQSTLEYAVVIVCIVGALVTMQTYISRSIQGRMRNSADTIGEQYAVGNATSDITTTYSYDTNTVVNTTEVNGLTTSTTRANFSESQTTDMTESVGP